jgi:hypothetical protein
MYLIYVYLHMYIYVYNIHNICIYLETYATFTLLNLNKIRYRQYVITSITELLKQIVYAYFSFAYAYISYIIFWTN